MGQVPAHHNALGLGVLRDGLDVEGLPRVELHARQEQQRRVVRVAVNDRADLLRRQHGALGLGEDCNQRIGGVEAVPADLRLDRILHRTHSVNSSSCTNTTTTDNSNSSMGGEGGIHGHSGTPSPQ